MKKTLYVTIAAIAAALLLGVSMVSTVDVRRVNWQVADIDPPGGGH